MNVALGVHIWASLLCFQLSYFTAMSANIYKKLPDFHVYFLIELKYLEEWSSIEFPREALPFFSVRWRSIRNGMPNANVPFPLFIVRIRNFGSFYLISRFSSCNNNVMRCSIQDSKLEIHGTFIGSSFRLWSSNTSNCCILNRRQLAIQNHCKNRRSAFSNAF